MNDDDLVGTPLWEASTDAGGLAPSKSAAPIWQQEVVDVEGRRRFHGAFTGGFSAGYYNTVGSAGGWAPATFRSSRSSRTEQAKQVAEDFMDEEDLQSFGGKQLQMNSDFDTLGSTAASVNRQTVALADSSRGLIPGPAPDELVTPSCEPVGKRLLKLMGWREGQGVGPRRPRKGHKSSSGADPPHSHADEAQVEFSASVLFAPRNTAVFNPGTGKSNCFGLGFDPHTDAPEFRNSGVNPKVQSTPGSGFGIGALEDDDDPAVYHSVDRSECVATI